MDIYTQFFDHTLAGCPYSSGQEFTGEIMNMVDALLSIGFDCRNLWGERLDMRGVVITPQEFETALFERMPERRENQASKAREAAGEAEKLRRHIASRYQAGSAALPEPAPSGEMAGWENNPAGKAAPREYNIIRAAWHLGLTEAEWLCFFLAAAVELDRKYERIFGYLQDNIAEKLPTVGLGAALFGLGTAGNSTGFLRAVSQIRDDGPLWRFLFVPMLSRNTDASALSRQMKLREPVISWLREGLRITDSLSAMIRFHQGEERLVTIDLEEACALEKEGTGHLTELLGTAVWAASLDGPPDQCRFLLSGSRKIEWGQFKKAADFLSACHIPHSRITEPGKMEPGSGAVMIRPVFTWEDLILEEAGLKQLKQLCGRVQFRKLVREEWGFGRKSPYGNGISALFYGPPGTGKTMAAQVVASELKVDLLKVDLSGLVSKYIGETEKNLSRVFDDAAESGSVLFFDEADSLFARRSGVSNSNDRYANMETGYLLQKFEEYEGICILATNSFHNMDDAFKRRITDIIRFSTPSAETRKKLWKSMIPEAAKVDEDLELDLYASRFELTGSAVKEIVTGAAYRAAMSGRGILREDVRESLKGYYMKYGKALTKQELEE